MRQVVAVESINGCPTSRPSIRGWFQARRRQKPIVGSTCSLSECRAGTSHTPLKVWLVQAQEPQSSGSRPKTELDGRYLATTQVVRYPLMDLQGQLCPELCVPRRKPQCPEPYVQPSTELHDRAPQSGLLLGCLHLPTQLLRINRSENGRAAEIFLVTKQLHFPSIITTTTPQTWLSNRKRSVCLHPNLKMASTTVPGYTA